MIGLLVKGGSLDTDLHTGRVLSEHKGGHLQVKERRLSRILPTERPEGALPHLDVGCLASETVRIKFCCLSAPVCGALSEQPWETSTPDAVWSKMGVRRS